jgi:hypothetical protein
MPSSFSYFEELDSISRTALGETYTSRQVDQGVGMVPHAANR